MSRASGGKAFQLRKQSRVKFLRQKRAHHIQGKAKEQCGWSVLRRDRAVEDRAKGADDTGSLDRWDCGSCSG